MAAIAVLKLPPAPLFCHIVSTSVCARSEGGVVEETTHTHEESAQESERREKAREREGTEGERDKCQVVRANSPD